MTRFTYVFVGLMVGGMTFLVSALYGPDLAAMVTELQHNAHPAMGEMTYVMSSPIVWAFANPVWSAILAGLLWPVVAFWIAVSSMLGVVSAGYGAVLDLTFNLGIGSFF